MTTAQETPPINTATISSAGGSGTATTSSAAAFIGTPEVTPYSVSPPVSLLVHPWGTTKLSYVVETGGKLRFWLDTQWGPTHLLTDQYKNRLLFSLLGAEATVRFGNNPLTDQLDTVTFAAFSGEVKRFFNLL